MRDYLVSQNVQEANVSATGYGKSDPIADNSNNAGRAQNRRVQLVVSGDAIGVQESAPGAASTSQPAAPASPPAQAAPSATAHETGVSNPPQ